MRIVKVKYSHQFVIPEHDRDAFKRAFLLNDCELDDEFQLRCYWQSFLVDLDAMPVSCMIDATFEPIQLPALEALQERERTVINQKVKVVVPGIGLLAIKQAAVRYDCCTDELNLMLREGWQILAICVQPDQRRPDYVLGKTTSED